MHRPRLRRCAATLVDLVVILGAVVILAMIATASLQLCQQRTRVSRVHADMLILARGLDVYRVDQGAYPPGVYGSKALGRARIGLVSELTTPVAYMLTNQLFDPFKSDPGPGTLGYQCLAPYGGWMAYQSIFTPSLRTAHLDCAYLESWGPDRYQNFLDWYILRDYAPAHSQRTLDEAYDPSNGTISAGDIGLLAGGHPTLAAEFVRR